MDLNWVFFSFRFCLVDVGEIIDLDLVMFFHYSPWIMCVCLYCIACTKMNAIVNANKYKWNRVCPELNISKTKSPSSTSMKMITFRPATYCSLFKIHFGSKFVVIKWTNIYHALLINFQFANRFAKVLQPNYCVCVIIWTTENT